MYVYTHIHNSDVTDICRVGTVLDPFQRCLQDLLLLFRVPAPMLLSLPNLLLLSVNFVSHMTALLVPVL